MAARAEIRIPARDGALLAATMHGDPAGARAILVVNGATAVPRGFYRAFADHFADRGFAALTYDYRGMGDSRHPTLTARSLRMHQWGTLDQSGVLAYLQKQHPETPLVAVGHSAGGQLVCLAEGAARYRALVGVAAQSGYWRHWPTPRRYRRFADWTLLMPPLATILGRVPGWMGLGEDLPAGVALEWARWCRHPDYLPRDDADRRRAGFAAIRAPFLSYSFSDDDYGPESAADWLAAQFVNSAVRRVHVAPREAGVDSLGHFGYFRPKVKDTLWRETEGFLLEHAA